MLKRNKLQQQQIVVEWYDFLSCFVPDEAATVMPRVNSQNEMLSAALSASGLPESPVASLHTPATNK